MRISVKAALAAALIAAAAPSAALADMSDGFARMSAQYGDKAAAYESKVNYDAEDVKVIYCPGEDAAVYTLTHVRTNPSAEVPPATVIDVDSKVKVWGFCDNGWCRVWARTPEGKDYFGWINGDLLNPADWSSPGAQEPVQTETPAPAESGEGQPEATPQG